MEGIFDVWIIIHIFFVSGPFFRGGGVEREGRGLV